LVDQVGAPFFIQIHFTKGFAHQLRLEFGMPATDRICVAVENVVGDEVEAPDEVMEIRSLPFAALSA
jgi:hypothetical protein